MVLFLFLSACTSHQIHQKYPRGGYKYPSEALSSLSRSVRIQAVFQRHTCLFPALPGTCENASTSCCCVSLQNSAWDSLSVTRHRLGATRIARKRRSSAASFPGRSKHLNVNKHKENHTHTAFHTADSFTSISHPKEG